MSGTAFPIAPIFHRTESSPTDLFHKRYLLNEFINPYTRIVYGVDKSRGVGASSNTASRIAVLVFDEAAAYESSVKLFQKLRSKFVTNMTDHWEEFAECGRAFLVIERGGLALDEYAYSIRKELHPRDVGLKHDCLMHIALVWAFIFNAGYSLHFSQTCFMQFGTVWKLYDPSCLTHGRRAVMNRLYVPFEVASLIANGHVSAFTYSPPDVAGNPGGASHSLEMVQLGYDTDGRASVVPSMMTFGMLLLELLLLHPLFAEKSIEEIYGAVANQQCVPQLRQAGILTKEELVVVQLVQHILMHDDSSDRMEDVASVMILVTDVLNDKCQQSFKKSTSPKKPIFVPAVN
eukprot:ANDGO_05844.mRNA.1 hypothetical protein